jgi:hypothetical protein
MHRLARLFRFHKLSIIRLNRLLTRLLLIQAGLGLLSFVAFSVVLHAEIETLFSEPLYYLLIIIVLYMFVRIYWFSRRHWWSWCVLTCVSVLGLLGALYRLVYWFIPYNFTVFTEETGYLPVLLIIFVNIAVLLLYLATVAGLLSYRIAGYHGIGRIAYRLSISAGLLAMAYFMA